MYLRHNFPNKEIYIFSIILTKLYHVGSKFLFFLILLTISGYGRHIFGGRIL
jgi:hypothetical protein